MKINVGDFFRPMELNSPPTTKDYGKAELLIRMADAFARTTNHCVYIIDYYKQGFLYVSENPLFLSGETPQCVLKAGYFFYFSHVPPADLEMLLEINDAGFNFYNKLPVADRLQYSIAYDFHLIQANKRPVLVNHHLTPLMLDEQANIWLALCVVTHATNKKPGNIKVTRKGSTEVYEFNRVSKEWEEQQRPKLTTQEKEILVLCMKGHSIKEIAEQMNISTITVKFHRGNILSKFKVKNINEAVSFATNYNVI